MRKVNYSLFFFALAALIGSLATFTYGYKFLSLFNLSHNFLYIGLCIIFGLASCFANAILGFYSLANIKDNINNNVFLLGIVSCVGAIPTGFFSYSGYEKILPLMFNIIVSSIVVIVNSGINFTAISNLIKSIKEIKKKKSSSRKTNLTRVGWAIMGLLIGTLISLTSYLATTDGISKILKSIHYSSNTALQISAILALIAWLPVAALYSNSTRIVTEKLYDFIADFYKNIRKVSYIEICIILFVMLSGSAFSKMVYDFYNPTNIIPNIFKSMSVQTFAHWFIGPFALLSTAAVNYFALTSLMQSSKKKKG